MVQNALTRTLVAAGILLALAGPASAASPDLVLSQVYGGGGNAGAPLPHDFIEDLKRGTAAVDVTGWSVQYASATGTTWTPTNLAGSVAPGHYLRVREAAGSGGTSDLPPPDASGSIAMSATSGKARLVAA